MTRVGDGIIKSSRTVRKTVGSMTKNTTITRSIIVPMKFRHHVLWASSGCLPIKTSRMSLNMLKTQFGQSWLSTPDKVTGSYRNTNEITIVWGGSCDNNCPRKKTSYSICFVTHYNIYRNYPSPHRSLRKSRNPPPHPQGSHCPQRHIRRQTRCASQSHFLQHFKNVRNGSDALYLNFVQIIEE